MSIEIIKNTVTPFLNKLTNNLKGYVGDKNHFETKFKSNRLKVYSTKEEAMLQSDVEDIMKKRPITMSGDNKTDDKKIDQLTDIYINKMLEDLLGE